MRISNFKIWSEVTYFIFGIRPLWWWFVYVLVVKIGPYMPMTTLIYFVFCYPGLDIVPNFHSMRL